MNVRFLDWDNVDKKGIPFDVKDVMYYFNNGVKQGLFPFVPRKSEITEEEVLKLWVPAKDRNISVVAVDRRAVGCGTVLIDETSNRYSITSGRESGEYVLTVNPSYSKMEVGMWITERIIEILKEGGLTARLHVSVDDLREIKMMGGLGYKPSLKEYNKRYADAGLNPYTYLYELP